MSRIADLIARMAVIPDKEKRATQVGEMIAIRDKLRESANLSDELRSFVSALEGVDGAEFVDKATYGIEQASTNAIKLKKRIEEGSGFERKRADDVLTLINERLKDSSTAVTRGWRTLIDDQSKRFKPLAEAATRALLPGAVALNGAIMRLEAWRDSPPRTPEAAVLYVSHAKRLPASIADLGLGGRAGKFMVDASNCRAKAKDLQDAEVLAFLHAYPAVWSILKVGL